MVSLQTFLLLLVSIISVSRKVSFGWVASTPSAHKRSIGTTTIKTAKFYKTSSVVLAEEAALAAVTAVAAATKSQSPASPSTLSTIRRLPWMEEGGPDAEEENNIFLDHWNWQFSFFENNLTNLRVRRDVEHGEDETIHDLYYATKDAGSRNSNSEKHQRCYTISLESDEYRDIRMTYIHCPAMQTFRCLSYPRNGDLPIMGMGIMKMGGVRNLAILDYQPLPAVDESEESKINDAYTNELLKLHQEFPSMGQSMTTRHFDSNDKRKYFTEFPLLGRSNDLDLTDGERADYQRDLRTAQTGYVAKHAELTKVYGRSTEPAKLRSEYALRRHSDFDTHIAETEPAGPFLTGVFGAEKGGRLVHNVIFPLSKKGRYGTTTEAASASASSSTSC